MAVTCANILVGIGVVAVDGNDIGGTLGGVSVEKTVDIYEKEVDQLLDACGLVPTKWTVTVTTNFAEGTLANLKIAWNEGYTIDFPIATERRLKLGYQQVLPEHTLEFHGLSPEGLDRQADYYRAIQASASAAMYGKGETLQFPVGFRCLPDFTLPLNEVYGMLVDTIP